jgi:hypothetical protein
MQSSARIRRARFNNCWPGFLGALGEFLLFFGLGCTSSPKSSS